MILDSDITSGFNVIQSSSTNFPGQLLKVIVPAIPGFMTYRIYREVGKRKSTGDIIVNKRIYQDISVKKDADGVIINTLVEPVADSGVDEWVDAKTFILS